METQAPVEEFSKNTTAQIISKSIIVLTVNIKKIQQLSTIEKLLSKKTKQKTEYKVKMVDLLQESPESSAC